VAVTKRPRREISGRGCFAIATTRSGRFFSLIERFHCLGETHILLSQVYCVWQVVKTVTIISNNPVFYVMTRLYIPIVK
jgi:hypothetical protein